MFLRKDIVWNSYKLVHTCCLFFMLKCCTPQKWTIVLLKQTLIRHKHKQFNFCTHTVLHCSPRVFKISSRQKCLCIYVKNQSTTKWSYMPTNSSQFVSGWTLVTLKRKNKLFQWKKYNLPFWISSWTFCQSMQKLEF